MEHVVILAGSGDLPWIAAKNLLQSRLRLDIFCLTDAPPPHSLRELCIRVHITRFYTDVLKVLKKKKPDKLLMLGKIDRSLIYKNKIFDSRTAILLKKLSGQSDYQLFSALAILIEKENVQIVPQNIFLPDCFLPAGRYGSTLNDKTIEDVHLSLVHSRKLNELDVGQSVVVGQGAVIALEASEGTDACIRRAGKILGNKIGIVCKMAKARHDLRFDMPTVGVGTLSVMAKANCRVLVIHEKKTIVVKPQIFLRKAKASGITVLSVPFNKIPIISDIKKLQKKKAEKKGNDIEG